MDKRTAKDKSASIRVIRVNPRFRKRARKKTQTLEIRVIRGMPKWRSYR